MPVQRLYFCFLKVHSVVVANPRNLPTALLFLLQILEVIPARLPPLDEIRDQVRLEWINEKEEARLNEQIASLWEKYSVVITNQSQSEN